MNTQKPTGYAVTWAEYNHNESKDALNCDLLGIYPTLDAANAAVREQVEDEAAQALSDYGPDDLPEEYAGKTAAQLADSWTWTKSNRFVGVDMDDGRECVYSIRPLFD